jgi:hypothetical protein
MGIDATSRFSPVKEAQENGETERQRAEVAKRSKDIWGKHQIVAKNRRAFA